MSYKRKTMVCLVIILLSATFLVIAGLNYPSLTPEMAFRRYEKQHLVGPSEILDTLAMEQLLYDCTTIGKSDYGYSIYHWSYGKNFPSGLFKYYPKDGNLTIVEAPLFELLPYVDNWQYPIFAFTDHPDAIHAVMTLQLSKEGITERYQLETEKQYDCCFVFSLNGSLISKESFHILYDAGRRADCTAEICITLYDQSGAQIECKKMAYHQEVTNA